MKTVKRTLPRRGKTRERRLSKTETKRKKMKAIRNHVTKKVGGLKPDMELVTCLPGFWGSHLCSMIQ